MRKRNDNWHLSRAPFVRARRLAGPSCWPPRFEHSESPYPPSGPHPSSPSPAPPSRPLFQALRWWKEEQRTGSNVALRTRQTKLQIQVDPNWFAQFGSSRLKYEVWPGYQLIHQFAFYEWVYLSFVGAFQSVFLQESDQRQLDLQQGKPHADAVARSVAERQEGVRMAFSFLRLWKPEQSIEWRRVTSPFCQCLLSSLITTSYNNPQKLQECVAKCSVASSSESKDRAIRSSM